MNVGDTITIDTGSGAETRKIASVGTAAGNHTTLWQPLPEGPVITIPAGSTNVPVTSVAGFAVGEKIALGYGATYPAVARDHGEVRGGHGHRGRQAGHASLPGGGRARRRDQHQGERRVANISAGDKIRLDIDSVGHGIETVTVTQGRHAVEPRGALGGCERRRDQYQGPRPRPGANGFAVGDKMTIGTPANQETVTITAVGAADPGGTSVTLRRRSPRRIPTASWWSLRARASTWPPR